MTPTSTEDFVGVYTVSEVCRILQPTMTPRKVHYWLDTDLLSDPVVHGRPGTPTLLSFRQLLEIRTLQHLRDNLNVSLQRARDAYIYVIDNLFAASWTELQFLRGVNAALVASVGSGESLVVPGGQGVWANVLEDFNTLAKDTRNAWETKILNIIGRQHVVSNARVQAGAPTVTGTRIETSTVASFATEKTFDVATVSEIVSAFPRLSTLEIVDALQFEGCIEAA